MATAVIGAASVIPSLWGYEGVEGVAGARAMMTVFALWPSLVTLGMGLPVWIGAGWLADGVFPDSAAKAPGPHGLRIEPLLALALSVMGIFFICEAIPLVIRGIAALVYSRLAGSSILGADAEQQALIWSVAMKGDTLAALARLMVGATLLAGQTRLSAWVQKELRSSLADEEPSN
jgi:hypothetical protein